MSKHNPHSYVVLATVVACSLSFPPSPLQAQSGTAPPPRSRAAYRSGVDLVPLTVTVTDTAGKYVRGLTGENFAIFEDGIEQPLSFFATSDVPVDVALVIDTSASMRNDLPIVQAAATGLVRALGPTDRSAVIAVNDVAGFPQSFTSDRDKLEYAIKRLTASGSTALYDGLYVVLRECQRERRTAPQVRRQALVLLSDGLDTKSRLSFDDVLDAARRADVSIYVISLSSEIGRTPQAIRPGTVMNAQYAMLTVARDSGGAIFYPKTVRELPAVYNAIAHELASQYELGYLPVKAGGDGAFRRVSVRVTPELKARARTRSGYYAPGTAASKYGGEQ